MSQVTTGLRAILSSPTRCSLFQYMMEAPRAWIRFVKNDLQPNPTANILDIGCGPDADVNYWDFDVSSFPKFGIVVTSGVVDHMGDDVARSSSRSPMRCYVRAADLSPSIRASRRARTSSRASLSRRTAGNTFAIARAMTGLRKRFLKHARWKSGTKPGFPIRIATLRA